jgi:hypothetical protein
MTLLDDIPQASLVALDTVVWIYEFEAHAVYSREPTARRSTKAGPFENRIRRR